MPNTAWEELKEALKKPPTPESMKEASESFERWRVVKLGKQGRSRPTLVSLGYRKTYPHAIPLEKIADELAKNPEFFDLMGRIVTKEKR